MVSDFAMAQFRFLEILLLVHGRWCYKRIVRLVLYFFYKNFVFGVTLMWFNSAAQSSGSAAYDDFYMPLYVTVYTGFRG